MWGVSWYLCTNALQTSFCSRIAEMVSCIVLARTPKISKVECWWKLCPRNWSWLLKLGTRGRKGRTTTRLKFCPPISGFCIHECLPACHLFYLAIRIDNKTTKRIFLEKQRRTREVLNEFVWQYIGVPMSPGGAQANQHCSLDEVKFRQTSR